MPGIGFDELMAMVQGCDEGFGFGGGLSVIPFSSRRVVV